MSWVTPHFTAGAGARNKRPACRWLRSSSYNCADQGSIVIKSLCRNWGPWQPRSVTPAGAPHNQLRARSRGGSERVFAGMRAYRP
ncbi:hypothetical protein F0Q45_13705 [Mycobacterium simiae]|uniref:Uncharacterized protein n=1 Tax=Mycobacterium simiae TaxID=1784 RepID=A0A5B1BNQ4_MYCSI|nr:hypothetical protein F0Q45_13705 [Mycobacterium simiae]